MVEQQVRDFMQHSVDAMGWQQVRVDENVVGRRRWYPQAIDFRREGEVDDLNGALALLLQVLEEVLDLKGRKVVVQALNHRLQLAFSALQSNHCIPHEIKG